MLYLPSAVEVLKLYPSGGKPLSVGVGGGEFLLYFGILVDTPFFGVHKQHLPRLKASFAGDFSGIEIKDADFARKDQKAPFGNSIASRAKTVPVLNTPGETTVAEQYSGGAVPWFHKDGVVLVECPEVFRYGIGPVETLWKKY